MRRIAGLAALAWALWAAAAGIFPLVARAGAAEPPRCDPELVTLLAGREQVSYAVELARTPGEIQRGLMFRRNLPRDVGMLFLFGDAAPRTFWMKNTYIPLDILFIDAGGRVLNVAAHTTPFSEELIPSRGDALAVLEINAGEAAAHGIVPGTQAVNPAFPDAPSPYACPR